MTVTEEKRPSRYNRWILVMAIQLAAVGIFAIGGASASAVDDIPASMSTALGVSVYAAKLILSGAVLMSAGLALTVTGSKISSLTTMIVLIVVGCVLVAIGWLDYWIMLLVAVFAAGMFAKMMRDTMSGTGG
jgi:hypothetical protein